MIKKAINKILMTVMDFFAPPPLPAPEPLPPIQVPESLPPPDPKTTAAEMREAARRLNDLADRLDPLASATPENYTQMFGMRVPNLPSPDWNIVMPEEGKLAGSAKVKRSDPKVLRHDPGEEGDLAKALRNSWDKPAAESIMDGTVLEPEGNKNDKILDELLTEIESSDNESEDKKSLVRAVRRIRRMP